MPVSHSPLLLPYEEDPVTQWQAGMRITAGRLNNFSPVAVVGTVTPATGFTLSSFDARKAGGVTEFNVILVRSGAALSAADSVGNLPDTVCCTLPTNCRPNTTFNGVYEVAGLNMGSVRISSDGTCTLTTLSATAVISTGRTINFSGSFATG